MNKTSQKAEDKIFPNPKNKKAIEDSIQKLFQASKEKDSAEYICAVKYFLDMHYLHAKTPARELLDTVQEIIDLSSKGIDGNISIKIFAYLYCQIFESDNWLNLLYNLLLILKDECVDQQPFKKMVTLVQKDQVLVQINTILASDNPQDKKLTMTQEQLNRVLNPFPTILSKVKKICDLSKEVGLINLAEILTALYKNDFRNDFTHSNFVIYKGFFNLFKANKNIAIEPLLEIMTSTLSLYTITGTKAWEEIESIVTQGSKEYSGKCGTVKVTHNADGSFLHESKMLCANF